MSFRPPSLPPTTQAAEGLMRRRWSAAEIEAAIAAGIIPAGECFELIGGEAVLLIAETERHRQVLDALEAFWKERLPAGIGVAVGAPMHLDADTFLRPDIIFFRQTGEAERPSAAAVLLAVEIAGASLDFDLRRKSWIYAAHDVPELWIVDAATLDTHVFRDAYDGEYEGRGLVSSIETLALPFASAVRMSLGAMTLP